MRIGGIALLAAVVAMATTSPVLGCSGLRVYEDANRNARRDAGETGVPGVRVSNGRWIMATSGDGATRFGAIGAHESVFVIKPPGFRFTVGADGLPDFWRNGGGHPQAECGEVALLRQERSTSRAGHGLRVLVLADPQPKSAMDVDYYRRDVIEPIRRSTAAADQAVTAASARPGTAADLGLTLGDVVDDDLSLYAGVNAATTRLGVPWLHAAGNHDLDLPHASDAESLRTFRRTYGPDTLAWEEPEASFVVLDDVVALPGQSPGYIGGLRSDQFEFLEAYMATARRDRLLVVALHVPLFEDAGRDTFRDADRERLFALLQPFDQVLLLSGHRHTQRHVFHGAASGWNGRQPLHEYNVGAASGAFWSGVKGAEGIPDATMADGTPNGHALLTVDDHGGYALRWHAARSEQDAGIGLHAPKVLRRGAWPGFAVYANVYMGHEGTRVEYRIGDAPWQAMQRVVEADPRVLAENLRDDSAEELRGYDRAPEAVPSTHLWRGRLPTDLEAGEHRIEVRAFDDWRGELRASTAYRLEDAPP